MDPIILIALLAGGAFLLFGTNTSASMLGPNGLQTGGPASVGGAQKIAAGAGNLAAQQISAGSGNSTAQDISAIGGLFGQIAPIAKNWNIGGGGSTGGVSTAVPAGSGSPNEALGGTQNGNNFDISGGTSSISGGNLAVDPTFGNTGASLDSTTSDSGM
jgi:hypothetical protein